MRALNRFATWAEPAIPASRLARLGLLAYLFVPLDILLGNRWIALHGEVPGDLYQPVMFARVFHLPTPTVFWVNLIQFITVGSALLSAVILMSSTRFSYPLSRIGTRVVRAIAAVGYLWWMFVAMSYGKVDHDRIGFLVLLGVLAASNELDIRDHTPDTRTGWLIRLVQIAVVATYFLAAFAKVRFGGWGWLNGATLTRAVIRRGTYWSNWLIDQPGILRIAQWILLWGELLSPAIFVIRKQRTMVIAVACLFGFHLMTFAALRIVFLPHCVALCAFLPLERLRLRRRASQAVATTNYFPRSL
jgi:hypothetical protein